MSYFGFAHKPSFGNTRDRFQFSVPIFDEATDPSQPKKWQRIISCAALIGIAVAANALRIH